MESNMSFGYTGRILRVNLSSEELSSEAPDKDFYRRYFGGENFIGYFLLNETPKGVEPLGPDNKLRVKSYFSHLFRTYSEAGIKRC